MAWRGVGLLWFSSLQREEDQLALVHLEALHVLLQRPHGLVSAVLIHNNADGAGILGVQSTTLRLLLSEAFAQPLLSVGQRTMGLSLPWGLGAT